MLIKWFQIYVSPQKSASLPSYYQQTLCMYEIAHQSSSKIVLLFQFQYITYITKSFDIRRKFIRCSLMKVRVEVYYIQQAGSASIHRHLFVSLHPHLHVLGFPPPVGIRPILVQNSENITMKYAAESKLLKSPSHR